MNQQLIEENKQKLLEERKRLQTVLGHQANLDGKGEFPGNYKPKYDDIGDGEDNALEVENYANDLAVTQSLEQKLSKVEAALKRIEEGTYGKNPDGTEVDEARLRALPEAG